MDRAIESHWVGSTLCMASIFAETFRFAFSKQCICQDLVPEVPCFFRSHQ